MFFDDDDTFEPHFFYEIENVLKNNSNKDIIYFNYNIIEEDRKIDNIIFLSKIDINLMKNNLENLWIKNFIPINCLIYKKIILKDLKFDIFMKSHEDWEFILSAYKKNVNFFSFEEKLVNIHKDFINNNRRGNSENTRNSFILQDILYVYKKHPAPNNELQLYRKNFIDNAGVSLPIEWY